MKSRFRLLFAIFVFAVIIIGLLSSIRLFSWSTLAGAHKFFYVSWSVLSLFGIIVLFFFSKFDDDVPVLNLDVVPMIEPVKVVDRELEELRREADKVPPFVPSIREPDDSSLIRNPEPMKVIPPIVTRLTEDVSMYQNRNILKPIVQQEDKRDDNEYSGVF